MDYCIEQFEYVPHSQLNIKMGNLDEGRQLNSPIHAPAYDVRQSKVFLNSMPKILQTAHPLINFQ